MFLQIFEQDSFRPVRIYSDEMDFCMMLENQ